MDKKIGLFWLRNDFRITKNCGLAEATKNHHQVVVFCLYKKLNYNNQEAQKWWLSKSLFNFKKELSNYNIDMLSNGFKVRDADGDLGAARKYIYLAMAKNPFKYATAR